MYSLILTDVDGTLIKDNQTLSKNTINTLRKARDRGVRICIASGRYIQAISFFKQELGIDDLILSAINGALIKDGEKTLRSVTLPDDVYSLAAEALNKKTKSFLAFGGENYALDATDEFFNKQTMICRQEGIRMEITDKRKVEKAIGESVYKLLVKDTDAKLIKKLENKLKKLIGDKAEVMCSSPYNLEVLPPRINKADTIYTLEKELGIPRNEMIAFGDWDNDIRMLKEAGLGIAMGNANRKVKKTAAFITRTNEDDGLSYALNMILDFG